MKSRTQIIKDAKAARIPFGKFEGFSVYGQFQAEPEHLKYLLKHPYALTYHKWLRHLIIRLFAAHNLDWHCGSTATAAGEMSHD